MSRPTMVALHRVIRGRKAGTRATGSWEVAITSACGLNSHPVRRFAGSFADSRLGGAVFAWMAACDFIADECTDDAGLEFRLRVPTLAMVRDQARPVRPRRRPTTAELLPVVLRMYRIEYKSASNPKVMHRWTSTWIVALRGQGGRSRSKSFNDRTHGGPVFSWLAACGHLCALQQAHPGIRVNRVPRPTPAEVASHRPLLPQPGNAP